MTLDDDHEFGELRQEILDALIASEIGQKHGFVQHSYEFDGEFQTCILAVRSGVGINLHIDNNAHVVVHHDCADRQAMQNTRMNDEIGLYEPNFLDQIAAWLDTELMLLKIRQLAIHKEIWTVIYHFWHAEFKNYSQGNFEPCIFENMIYLALLADFFTPDDSGYRFVRDDGSSFRLALDSELNLVKIENPLPPDPPLTDEQLNQMLAELNLSPSYLKGKQ